VRGNYIVAEVSCLYIQIFLLYRHNFVFFSVFSVFFFFIFVFFGFFNLQSVFYLFILNILIYNQKKSNLHSIGHPFFFSFHVFVFSCVSVEFLKFHLFLVKHIFGCLLTKTLLPKLNGCIIMNLGKNPRFLLVIAVWIARNCVNIAIFLIHVKCCVFAFRS